MPSSFLKKETRGHCFKRREEKRMKTARGLRGIGILLAVVLLLGTGTPAMGAGEDAPMLSLTSVPAYGEDWWIEEEVLYDTDPGALAVTRYFQVAGSDTLWGPKPTTEEPSVSVDEDDDTFYLPFVTGGSDVYAVAIYIYLIPAEFVPTSDWTATEVAAYDKLIVTRTEEGDVTTLPREGKWVLTDDTQATQTTAVLFVNAPTISLCYSPYVNGENPETGDEVPIAQIEEQLSLLRPYADTIRTFGVSGELYKLFKIAKETYGYRVIAGCWIEAGYTEEQVTQALDALVDIADNGWCDIAVVGSECLYREDYTQEQLAEYVQYVKQNIENRAITVTSSNTAAGWLEADTLAAACDVIMATYYPFFNGEAVENAAKSLEGMYNQLKERYPDKRIIFSETGWPTEGSAEGDAVPSEENAALYFSDVYAWAEANQVEVVYFSAFDESWKTEGTYGDIGAHWGHFTGDGVLKDCYTDAYAEILAEAD